MVEQCTLCAKKLKQGDKCYKNEKFRGGDKTAAFVLEKVVGESEIQSKYVCRLCFNLLNKWERKYRNILSIESEIKHLGGKLYPAGTTERQDKRKEMWSTPETSSKAAKTMRTGTPRVGRIQLDIGRNLLEACGQLKHGFLTVGVSVIEVVTSLNSVTLSIENADITHFVERSTDGCHIDLTVDAFISMPVDNQGPTIASCHNEPCHVTEEDELCGASKESEIPCEENDVSPSNRKRHILPDPIETNEVVPKKPRWGRKKKKLPEEQEIIEINPLAEPSTVILSVPDLASLLNEDVGSDINAERAVGSAASFDCEAIAEHSSLVKQTEIKSEAVSNPEALSNRHIDLSKNYSVSVPKKLQIPVPKAPQIPIVPSSYPVSRSQIISNAVNLAAEKINNMNIQRFGNISIRMVQPPLLPKVEIQVSESNTTNKAVNLAAEQFQTSVSQSTMSQSTLSQPTVSQSTMFQSTLSQSTMSQSTMSQLTMPHSTMSHSTMTQSPMSQSRMNGASDSYTDSISSDVLPEKHVTGMYANVWQNNDTSYSSKYHVVHKSAIPAYANASQYVTSNIDRGQFTGGAFKSGYVLKKVVVVVPKKSFENVTPEMASKQNNLSNSHSNLTASVPVRSIPVPKGPSIPVPKEPPISVPKEPSIPVPKEPSIPVPKEPPKIFLVLKLKEQLESVTPGSVSTQTTLSESHINLTEDNSVPVPKEPQIPVPKEPHIPVPKEPRIPVPKPIMVMKKLKTVTPESTSKKKSLTESHIDLTEGDCVPAVKDPPKQVAKEIPVPKDQLKQVPNQPWNSTLSVCPVCHITAHVKDIRIHLAKRHPQFYASRCQELLRNAMEEENDTYG